MANYTLIGGDQKQYGPVTDEQLRQWIRDGRVNPQSQVKAEGDAEWRPVSAFPEFAMMFGNGTAGSTPSAAPSSQVMRLKTRLKLLLCMEVLFIICTIALGIFDDSLLPEQLRDYEASVANAPHTLIGGIVVAVDMVLLATALTATIGLFLSWRPARALFLWTRIAVVVSSPLQGPNVESGWENLFDGAAVLVAGVIIGMLYYSQLRELYDKAKSAA
jgi:hypothetical protein